ncbi:acyltransferase [Geodermatophilus sp. DSM 45219]|uniref:acyltransferase family protein n=1 Tax=Geodermatophilus sp. DSM 45219 TaxID=1881103 RepID=UPI000888A640|nr:acyltransferase [Geodermatophilus sp. DSM 45219]SDN54889.1 Peptidoglycan/LPS O-acetylase OafA/YrhL, contains acyltransferase and SGNH-hydrolase domains [Geodermatophilus sp. DSM 45219]
MARQRDRYIDVLRAVALIRVTTYHVLGWAWLPLVFPSMGIMFALAGGLVAASLDRADSVRAFWCKRAKRLLIPFWVFAAVVLTGMWALGWSVTEEAGQPLSWGNAWTWVLPLSTPPSSAEAVNWVSPLWYVQTYLWLVLLSPVLLWLFRRWPARLMALPPVVLVVVTLGLVTLDGRIYDTVVFLATYACCWLLGFAHHDRTLRRLPLGRTLLAGVALLGAGLWYALSQREALGTYDIDDIPLANMLYCLGAVLILLRLYPRPGRLDRLGRVPGLDAAVSVFSNRAMTIYLWGNLAIWLVPPVLAATPLAQYHTDDASGTALGYAAAWTLLWAVVLLVGWVEDVAAGRRPRLLPWSRTTPVAVPAPQPVRQVSFADNVAAEAPSREEASAPVPHPARPDGRAEAVPRSGAGR